MLRHKGTEFNSIYILNYNTNMVEENENKRKTDTKNDVMNCLIKVEQKKDKISIYVQISWNGSHHERKKWERTMKFLQTILQMWVTNLKEEL